MQYDISVREHPICQDLTTSDQSQILPVLASADYLIFVIVANKILPFSIGVVAIAYIEIHLFPTARYERDHQN
jgi:hypothetical protein